MSSGLRGDRLLEGLLGLLGAVHAVERQRRAQRAERAERRVGGDRLVGLDRRLALPARVEQVAERQRREAAGDVADRDSSARRR